MNCIHGKENDYVNRQKKRKNRNGKILQIKERMYNKEKRKRKKEPMKKDQSVRPTKKRRKRGKRKKEKKDVGHYQNCKKRTEKKCILIC